jgi:uncharacterized protein (TIGR02145 family)
MNSRFTSVLLFAIIFQSTYCQSIMNLSAKEFMDNSILAGIKITYNIQPSPNNIPTNIYTLLIVSADGGRTFFSPNWLHLKGNIKEQTKEGINEVIWDFYPLWGESLISDKVIFKIIGFPSSLKVEGGLGFIPLAYINGQVWSVTNLTTNTTGSYPDPNPIGNIELVRYYTWESAMRSCPSGTHLPSKEEFDKLIEYAGGEGVNAYNELTISGGNREMDIDLGLDGSGGYIKPDGSSSTKMKSNSDKDAIQSFNDNAFYWTSTPVVYSNVNSSGRKYALYVSETNKTVKLTPMGESCGNLVRCVLDDNKIIICNSNPLTFVMIKTDPDIQIIKPTLFIKWYVDRKIIEWKKKGEFEKTVDYEKRISSIAQTKITEFAAEGLRLLKSRFTKQINWDRCYLGLYDADNELFSITSYQLGNFYFKVPIAEAPTFKDNWSNLQIVTIDYCPSGEKLMLARISMKNPNNNKVYSFDNKLETSLDFSTIPFYY